jgi:hypothetical protein
MRRPPETPVIVRMSALAAASSLAIVLCGCEPPAPAPSSATTAPSDAAAAPAAAAAAPADDVKIMKEYWPSGGVKFFNEMRRGAAGKWDKNGIGRAYYETGTLEREGMYRDGTRIGRWTYFNPDGTVQRVEERGDGKPAG